MALPMRPGIQALTAAAALLAALAASCGTDPRPPHPSPPQQPTAAPHAPVMDELLADYRAAGLPFPPPDASMVRYDSTGFTVDAGGSRTPLRYLAFLLPSAAGAPRTLLVGTRRHTLPDDAAIVPMDPTPGAAEGITSRWSDPTFEINAGLATAIQCKARGWDALAERLLDIALKSGAGHWAGIFSQPQGATPREAMTALGRAHWANELLEPGTDRAAIYRHLDALFSADRWTPPQGEGAPDPRPFLRSLEKSLRPSAAPPGSIDALIDDLVDMTSPRSEDGQPRDDPRYTRLAERGFEAVPALIAHLDDDRLTRSVKQGFNNFPTYHQRIEGVVSDLLQAIAGDDLGKDWLRRQQGYALEKAQVEAWWNEAKATGEEAYLVAHVLPGRKGAEWPNAHQLTLIARKYPSRLPAIYTAILDSRPEMQSYPVAKAITASALPEAEKRRLFLKAAEHRHLEHRRAALWELQRLDPETFVKVLVQTLDALPKTPKEPYWKSREGAFANLVMETGDPRAWQALLRAARRADVGLRLELMNPMNYTYIGDRQRAERLRLLVALLDDQAVRIASQDPEMFSGPSAAFTFPQISVRDFAAMKIASILRLGVTPEPSWSAAQWEELRARVRREVERLR